MHVAALTFARNAGVEPDLAARPELERALLFGPLSPISFRLRGIDAHPTAPSKVLSAAATFGVIRSDEFTAEEEAMRQLLRSGSVQSTARTA